MKPFAFDYEKPATIAEALALLGEAGDDAKVLAGGQSLGPMLNMRLIRPRRLIDITGIPDLHQITDDGDAIVFGACVTHAAIEDGRVADPSHGLMPRIARDIAYRAIRNRGTIGGSIALADPSAEWTVTLLALDAVILVRGESGARDIPAADFFLGAYTTALPEDTILTALRIPQLTRAARFGFYKVCRKTGEFASSLAIAVSDPERGVARVALGGTSGAPLRLAAVERLLSDLDRWDDQAAGKVRTAADTDLMASGRGFDADARHLHGITVMRAVREAVS